MPLLHYLYLLTTVASNAGSNAAHPGARCSTPQDRATPLLSSASLEEVSWLLRAFARLRHLPSAPFLAAATAAIRKHLNTRRKADAVPDGALVTAIWAIAAFRHRPREGFLEVLEHRMLHRVGRLSAGQLSAFVWALSYLYYKPRPQMLAAIRQAAEAAMAAGSLDRRSRYCMVLSLRKFKVFRMRYRQQLPALQEGAVRYRTRKLTYLRSKKQRAEQRKLQRRMEQAGHGAATVSMPPAAPPAPLALALPAVARPVRMMPRRRPAAEAAGGSGVVALGARPVRPQEAGSSS